MTTSETLPLIDLRLLSQSDLQILSLSSPSSADFSLSSPSSDIVIPSIDRSVFNESAGSRKQTYSRLRLAPRGSDLSKIDVSSKILHLNRTEKDTDEDRKIVALIRSLFDKDVDDSSVDKIVSVRVGDGDSVSHTAEDQKSVALIKSLFDNDNVGNSSVDRLGSVGVENGGDLVIGSSNIVLQPHADNSSVVRLVSVHVADGDLVPGSCNVVLQEVVDVGSDLDARVKKKRGRKPKVKTDKDMILGANGGIKSLESEDIGREIVNKNCVVVVCGLRKMDNDMILGENEDGGIKSNDHDKEIVKKKRGRKPKVKAFTDMILGENGGVKSEDLVLDREIVNKNGVVVDFSALAITEDPYGDELRRKTEGLVTKEDFWGFLGGLVGQWASTHKKRRIVAASDFGDALPKGWKLILFIKKKAGLCWLICRRYISPSGREFGSCKEISSYLLSLCRPQDANTLDQSDDNYHLALEISGSDMLQQTSSHTFNENNRTDNRTTPTSIISLSTSYGKETPFTQLKNQKQEEAPVEGALKCPMCTMSFDSRDEFLHHNFSSHKKTGKKRKQGTRVSDGVIIKDGIFECQFCHKTFNERHRYNSHVGNHVKNFAKNLETSSKSINPVSASGDPPIMTGMQFTILSSTDSIPIPYNGTVNDCSNFGFQLNNLKSGFVSESCIKEYNNEPHFLTQISHDMVNDESCEPHVSKVCGSAAIGADQINFVPSLQTTLCMNQSNNLLERFDEHTLTKHASDRDGSGENKQPMQGLGFEWCSHIPYVKKKTCSTDNSAEIFPFNTIEELNNSGTEEPTTEFDINSRPAEDTASSFEQDRRSGKGPLFISYKKQSVVNNLGASVSIDTIVSPSTMEEHEFDVIKNCENSESSNYSGVNVHALSLEKRKDYENCSFLQPRNEQSYAVHNNFVDTCNNSLEDLNKVRRSESRLFNPSFHQQKNGVKKLLTFTRDNSKSEEIRNSWSNEPMIGLGSSQVGLDINRNFDGHSSVYSGKENLFGFKNNVNAIADNVVQEEQRQETGFRSSLFGNDQLFDIENNSKNIYTDTDWEGDKLRTVDCSRNNVMMIDVGSSLGRPVVAKKNDEENIMQSDLPDCSVHVTPSSSCFTGFDFISDKNENELFRGSEKFDGVSGFGGVQSTSMEQMEYNFFTPQSNSLAENSKVLSYDTDMEQAFDSSSPWFGQEAMLSKTTSRNHQFSSMCAWCENEFHHEAFNSGTQTGSIGYICPTCKDKMSGQLNVLES